MDFAVVHAPLGASQSVSIRRFRRLPMSPVSPALLLCARSSRVRGMQSRLEAELVASVRCLATAAAHSVPSLHAIWARCAQDNLDRPDDDVVWNGNGETGDLPPGAMLMVSSTTPR
ncbi:hypothetical protein OBBRIDRAFT_161394 [Obba rivulosa]|uniref:Uncharacterized protein n=1 Tax=Obba rivulosa TaxID=1052685 RepID=A0A8E2AQ75_9APHY|nr:hypothetical protein OBBRIDRAFT_161394 [Obba rivulosa]